MTATIDSILTDFRSRLTDAQFQISVGSKAKTDATASTYIADIAKLLLHRRNDHKKATRRAEEDVIEGEYDRYAAIRYQDLADSVDTRIRLMCEHKVYRERTRNRKRASARLFFKFLKKAYGINLPKNIRDNYRIYRTEEITETYPPLIQPKELTAILANAPKNFLGARDIAICKIIYYKGVSLVWLTEQ